MEAIVVVIFMVVAYFVISNYNRIQWEKKKRREIRERFGKKPEHKEKDTKKFDFIWITGKSELR